MRIVMIHNRYQQSGGEDHVFRAETALLRARGHEVEAVEENNDAIVRWTAASKAAFDCVYSFASARSMSKLIDDFRPDVAHIHNFFPRLSPSVHYACRQTGVPVVQTLHNYRLLCPGATLFREGKVCEDCTRAVVPWPAVAHACYRDSRTASAAVANMVSIHRALRTWDRAVARFITPSEFARSKFIENGFPAEKIVAKPNFLSDDPGMSAGSGKYALFVGRLSQEKGLDTLLAAWRQLPSTVPLKIAGDGPMMPVVKEAAASAPGVEWLGLRNHEDVLRLMTDAAFLIVPSNWYENQPIVVIEAFAVGLPVFASRLGGLAELVRDGETGKLFAAGSSEALAATVEWAIAHADELRAMRRNARLEFESRYTADANYSQLMRVYESARGDNCARKSEAK